MNHILDEEYKGHELVYIQQDDGLFIVDIRIDNSDGEFIAGYTDIIDVSSARLKAHGFIDGWKAAGKD